MLYDILGLVRLLQGHDITIPDFTIGFIYKRNDINVFKILTTIKIYYNFNNLENKTLFERTSRQ